MVLRAAGRRIMGEPVAPAPSAPTGA